MHLTIEETIIALVGFVAIFWLVALTYMLWNHPDDDIDGNGED